MTGSSGPVDVSAACPVLAKWDLHDNLDSPRRPAVPPLRPHLLGAVPVVGTPGIYSTQFDVDDPVDTPNGLNTRTPWWSSRWRTP